MWLMLQQNTPEDFVIATGCTTSLESFVQNAFECVGLDWREYVDIDRSLFRPTDIRYGAADPSYATRRLQWRAGKQVDEVIALMSRSAQEQLKAVVHANGGLST